MLLSRKTIKMSITYYAINAQRRVRYKVFISSLSEVPFPFHMQEVSWYSFHKQSQSGSATPACFEKGFHVCNSRPISCRKLICLTDRGDQTKTYCNPLIGNFRQLFVSHRLMIKKQQKSDLYSLLVVLGDIRDRQ